MSDKVHWSVIAAYIYFILILAVNLSCTVWANMRSYNIKAEYRLQAEHSSTIKSSLAEFSADNPLQFIQPLAPVEERASTATSIFITGIAASFISEYLLLYPKKFMSLVEKIVERDCFIDFESCEKFQRLMVVCILLLSVFDLLGAFGYWDFAKAFIK